MTEYQFIKGRWRGHSTNDTIPPQAERYLSRKEDTDTGIISYWDGAEWIRSGTHDTGANYIQMSEIPVPEPPIDDNKIKIFLDESTGLFSQINSSEEVISIGSGSGGGGDVTASSTTTFTNKTFNADGTGNSITNIENSDIKSGASIDWTKINKTGSVYYDNFAARSLV